MFITVFTESSSLEAQEQGQINTKNLNYTPTYYLSESS